MSITRSMCQRRETTRSHTGARFEGCPRTRPDSPTRSVAHPRANMPTFDDVRTIAMALPEAEEIVTWEVDITFRVRKKIFAMGGEGSDHVSIKATPATQADLIDLDPETFRPA